MMKIPSLFNLSLCVLFMFPFFIQAKQAQEATGISYSAINAVPQEKSFTWQNAFCFAWSKTKKQAPNTWTLQSACEFIATLNPQPFAEETKNWMSEECRTKFGKRYGFSNATFLKKTCEISSQYGSCGGEFEPMGIQVKVQCSLVR